MYCPISLLRINDIRGNDMSAALGVRFYLFILGV